MGLGGRFKREGTYIYLGLIHIVVWQTPTQHCKATVPQLKKNGKKSEKEKKAADTAKAASQSMHRAVSGVRCTSRANTVGGRSHRQGSHGDLASDPSQRRLHPGPLRPPNPQTTCTLSTSSSELNWILKIQGPGSNQSLHLKSPPNYFHPNYLSGLTMIDHQTSFFYNWKMQLKRRHNYSVSQTIEYLRSTLHNLD